MHPFLQYWLMTLHFLEASLAACYYSGEVADSLALAHQIGKHILWSLQHAIQIGLKYVLSQRGTSHEQHTSCMMQNKTAWLVPHLLNALQSSSCFSDHTWFHHPNISNPLNALQFCWYTVGSSWHFHCFMLSTILHHSFLEDLSLWQSCISGHTCVEWDMHSTEEGSPDCR